MVRILVFGMNDNPGGIESFLMNYIRRLQGNGFQFDFLCNTKIVAYEEELRERGCHIKKITARSENPRKYHQQLNQFFLKHASKYQTIWVNVCSLANIDYLKMAKKYGISRRIIHSHNSQNMDSLFRGFLHKINRFRIRKYATDYWSCSESAGEWFYGRKILNSNKYKIIRNAIDASKFSFDSQIREVYRTKFGVENCIVIGNIGRLHFQKNQMFLLEVFYNYRKYNPNSKLWIIGQGEDEAKLKARASELGIYNEVEFMGVREDIPQLLSAMDVFVFPSLFEGLSLVSLEVQASGIPCLVSDNIIQEDARISDELYMLSLEEGAEKWAYVMNEKVAVSSERKNYKESLKKAGYDIEIESDKLRKEFIRA